MIVIDVGCQHQENEESVRTLIRRFAPNVLFGFDPFPDLQEGVKTYRGSVIIRRRLAAWVFDGTIPYSIEGWTSGYEEGSGRNGDKIEAGCFDLARFIDLLPAPVPLSKNEIILKLDCEGAEYKLLPHLKAQGVDKKVSRILVEWHNEEMSHGLWTEQPTDLSCPIDLWPEVL